jgi:hypothetical protein
MVRTASSLAASMEKEENPGIAGAYRGLVACEKQSSGSSASQKVTFH